MVHYSVADSIYTLTINTQFAHDHSTCEGRQREDAHIQILTTHPKTSAVIPSRYGNMSVTPPITVTTNSAFSKSGKI